MWPEAIRAVREIRPKVFLFENVRGLLRPAFDSYVGWICAYLSSPSRVQGKKESIGRHFGRLMNAAGDSEYVTKVVPVNAADFGVPQKRHRVIFLGVRRDVLDTFTFPLPTHSKDKLAWDKWITGEYWKRHGLRQPADNLIPSSEIKLVKKLRESENEPQSRAWVTCRDAFWGLGEPGMSPGMANHQFQAGARSYPGHTGSPIDEPAKALKAGVHGVPGGENMLAREDHSVRYFTVREAARLQGLPDELEFQCSWTESMRQIGNAVPVQLAERLGSWLVSLLTTEQSGTLALSR